MRFIHLFLALHFGHPVLFFLNKSDGLTNHICPHVLHITCIFVSTLIYVPKTSIFGLTIFNSLTNLSCVLFVAINNLHSFLHNYSPFKKWSYLIWQTTYLTKYLIFHLLYKPKTSVVNLDSMHITYISIRYLVNNYGVGENNNNIVLHP